MIWLHLVRHPKPQVASGICYGASDVLCSAQELSIAADQLLNVLPKKLQITSSPLSRCEQLSQYLCGREASFIYRMDPRIAEMNFGAWEMKAWDQIAPAELSAWTAAFASYRCGGSGESAALLLQRVARCLQEVIMQGKDQIWITHAGVMRAVLWLMRQPSGYLAQLSERADPENFLASLRAADWPGEALGYAQVHPVQIVC